MSSMVYLVLHASNGTLSKREYDPKVHNIETAFQSSLQCVGVWVKRTVGDPPQDYWDEFSGNSQYCVKQSEEGIVINAYDDAPEKTRTKELDNDVFNAWRTLDNKLASAYMGGGANWDVVDNGTGSYYEEKLAEARTLVGYPS